MKGNNKMYSIKKTAFGVEITFDGSIKSDQMQQWLDESKAIIPSLTDGFGVFVDMRTLKPLDDATQTILLEGQKQYKQAGMTRSVVIVNSFLLKLQFARLAKETGIDQWERYIDASSNSEWQQSGIDWLVDAKDPDPIDSVMSI